MLGCQAIALPGTEQIVANSDITVASGLKSYPKIWCHTPTLSLEISEILNIFYFY